MKTLSVKSFNREIERATKGMSKQGIANVRCLMLYKCLIHENNINKKGN